VRAESSPSPHGRQQIPLLRYALDASRLIARSERRCARLVNGSPFIDTHRTLRLLAISLAYNALFAGWLWSTRHLNLSSRQSTTWRSSSACCSWCPSVSWAGGTPLSAALEAEGPDRKAPGLGSHLPRPRHREYGGRPDHLLLLRADLATAPSLSLLARRRVPGCLPFPARRNSPAIRPAADGQFDPAIVDALERVLGSDYGAVESAQAV
jgi:hypothetical protein